MTCEIVGTELALFVAWGTPQVVDIERVVEQVRLRVERTGSPIYYVTRVPADAPAPDSEVRWHMNQRLSYIADSSASYQVILEGNGFTAAMKRGVLLSLFQLSRRRGVFAVHATVDEFQRKVAPVWRPEVARLMEIATRRGLVQGKIPSECASESTGMYRAAGSHVKSARDSKVA